jgi:NADPH:quinone reductase-like Zn-dependent oxidoreductase
VKAVVVRSWGDPGVLEVVELPRPRPRPGWTLIEVKAFGLNRSELMIRQGMFARKHGDYPEVTLPRVLGIECAGVVAATARGMGGEFDGSYAEYALVPADDVIPLDTRLDWATLAALPLTYLTARGSLDALELRAGHRLLIRGMTSALGTAALSLAKARGAAVAGTTRNLAKAPKLTALGADHVLLDDRGLAARLRQPWPDGADRILDLVGGPAILDSLRLTTAGGIVCGTGQLSGRFSIPGFEPIEAIPAGVKLTTFSSRRTFRQRATASTHALQAIVNDIEAGAIRPVIDRTFTLEQVPDAHRHMEQNQALGKVVVVL